MDFSIPYDMLTDHVNKILLLVTYDMLIFFELTKKAMLLECGHENLIWMYIQLFDLECGKKMKIQERLGAEY